MKLIALLTGLLIERLATQLFHLRQLRWPDAVIDAGFRRASGISWASPLVAALAIAVLLVLPLALLLFFFGHLLYDFAYLFIAVVVLFFSLGPKDIGEQVDEYCAALELDDQEAVRRTAKVLLERDIPQDPLQRVEEVEEAVCVQANNRLFAVIFWFILLGPLGAWTYRVTDLIRRRAVFNAARESRSPPEPVDDANDEDPAATIGDERSAAVAATRVHGWLAWIPARLTALGYALAGSFDDAIAAWRPPAGTQPASLHQQSEDLLARVGIAALALAPRTDETPAQRGIRGASAANGLVFRLLGIWAVVIAAMTLYGWSL